MTLDAHLPASDNIKWQALERRVQVLERTQPPQDATAGAFVAATEGGADLPIGDLATAGPEVTVTITDTCKLTISASATVVNAGAGLLCTSRIEVWALALSGSIAGTTTVFPGPQFTSTDVNSVEVDISRTDLQTLPAGSYTISLKYTTVGTAFFLNRSLVVRPF